MRRGDVQGAKPDQYGRQGVKKAFRPDGKKVTGIILRSDRPDLREDEGDVDLQAMLRLGGRPASTPSMLSRRGPRPSRRTGHAPAPGRRPAPGRGHRLLIRYYARGQSREASPQEARQSPVRPLAAPRRSVPTAGLPGDVQRSRAGPGEERVERQQHDEGEERRGHEPRAPAWPGTPRHQRHGLGPWGGSLALRRAQSSPRAAAAPRPPRGWPPRADAGVERAAEGFDQPKFEGLLEISVGK